MMLWKTSASSGSAMQLAALVIIVAVSMCMGGALHPVAASKRVDIINSMGEELQVECMSKDDDLSVHTLWAGDVYTFMFTRNIWGTTLFACNMWAQGYKTLHVNVYKGPSYSSNCDCDWCIWEIKPSGVYCMHKWLGSWPATSAPCAPSHGDTQKQLNPVGTWLLQHCLLSSCQKFCSCSCRHMGLLALVI